MDRLEKTKALSLKKADAEADIGLINQHSVRELKPEEVYCFSLVLCDNDVDRDTERFTDKTLDKLAPMFVGKPGIMDHRWSAEKQVARLYRVEVEETTRKNSLGEPLRQLKGSAYIPINDGSKPIIDAIDGGILKEVSVGCSAGKCSCSICGEPLRMNWSTWKHQCENGHIKGDKYDGKLCVGNLEEPKEAYEFSFVAVPSQRGACVTKSAQGPDEAFALLMEADLSGCGEMVKALMPRLQSALVDAEERTKRASILEENKKYLGGIQ